MARLKTSRGGNEHFMCLPKRLLWLFPLISATVWFAMLWALLIIWLVRGRPRYESMEYGTIAYISDIGASDVKALFVAGSSVTSAFFFLSLLSVRFNIELKRRLERIFDILSLLAGTMGAVSLILLSVFDTARYTSLHRLFLFLFMLGIVLSAIFTTIEYRRLGKTYAEQKVLRYSYQAKRFIFIIEILLSIAFGVTMYKRKQNAAAILEWTIAFIFTFYVLSFFFDLRPSAGTTALRAMTHDNRMDDPSSSDLERDLNSSSSSGPEMQQYGQPNYGGQAPVTLNREHRQPESARRGPVTLNQGYRS